jgi:hypothetical protein
MFGAVWLGFHNRRLKVADLQGPYVWTACRLYRLSRWDVVGVGEREA